MRKSRNLRAAQVDEPVHNGRSELLIVIFPRHFRDETRMREIAREFLDDAARVVSVRFLPRSLLEIRAYELFSLVFRRRGRNPDVLFWPSLTLGWSLDAGCVRASVRLVSHLTSHPSDVSHIVIGDSHQESSYAVKVLQSRTGAKLVLSPEGIGVFRARFGGYRWQIRDYREMKARLLSDLVFARSGDNKRRVKSGIASASWRLRRLLDVLLSGGELTSDLLEISSVDVLISDWPPGVDFGIEYKSHWRLVELSPASGAREENKAVDPRIAFFIHQPMALSVETWVRALAGLPELALTEITVKVHRDSRGLKELKTALHLSYPSCAIRVLEQGLAEDLIRKAVPGAVIGVSSTVLLNLALGAVSSRLYSVAEGLRKYALDDELSIVQNETGHQLEALKSLAGPTIEYV